ncbi:MAG: stage II sporulation protein M, partial [Pontixanthobacter sp.]
MKIPKLAIFGKTPTMETAPTIEAAALRSDRFRQEREGDWQRLDALLTRIEKGQLRKLSDADVLELPTLYRTAASSLAVARETSLDAATLRYLENLVQRAWFQVYGPRQGLTNWLRAFLGGNLSRAVRSIWLDICIALFVMIAGTITGWLLVMQDSEWYYTLVPAQFTDTRVPGASREILLESLKVEENAQGLSGFAAQLFTNNAGVSILAFALGFAFGIPSLLLLIQNMA